MLCPESCWKVLLKQRLEAFDYLFLIRFIWQVFLYVLLWPLPSGHLLIQQWVQINSSPVSSSSWLLQEEALSTDSVHLTLPFSCSASFSIMHLQGDSFTGAVPLCLSQSCWYRSVNLVLSLHFCLLWAVTKILAVYFEEFSILKHIWSVCVYINTYMVFMSL